MGGAAPRDWRIVEGLLLKEGKIRQLPGRRLSQLQLREARAFPSYPLVVDGEKWKYNYTIDRLTYNRERNLYYLFDYKTGKSRERSGERKLTHQDQLKLYGSFVIQEHPEITPDRLVLRLIYVAEEGDDQNTIFDFQLDGMDEVRRLIAEAHEQVRIYRKFFRTVSEVLAAGGEREFLRILPRHLVLDAQGQFIARNFPVDALVALPERFPPIQIGGCASVLDEFEGLAHRLQQGRKFEFANCAVHPDLEGPRERKDRQVDPFLADRVHAFGVHGPPG